MTTAVDVAGRVAQVGIDGLALAELWALRAEVVVACSSRPRGDEWAAWNGAPEELAAEAQTWPLELVQACHRAAWSTETGASEEVRNVLGRELQRREVG